MDLLAALLLLLATVVFLIAAFGGEPRRWQLVAGGLALVAFALFLQGIDGVSVNTR